MKSRSLPGRWLDAITGTLTAFALHPRRPWLALARTLPGHRTLVERHDLDTGAVTLVHEAEWFVVTDLAWVDDVVALCGETRDGLTLRLCDASGNGVLAEARPKTAAGRGRFLVYPRFAEYQVFTGTGGRSVFERFTLRSSHDAHTITRLGYEHTLSPPLPHPDAGCAALVYNPLPGVERLVVREGVARLFDLAAPPEIVNNRHTLLAWTSPDAFLLQTVPFGKGHVESLWIVETAPERVRQLWPTRDAPTPATRTACAPDGAQVALLSLDAEGRHTVQLLQVSTGAVLRLEPLSGSRGPVPAMHWLDAELLLTIDAPAPSVRLHVHHVASGTTADYTLDDATSEVALVAVGDGRVVLHLTYPEARYFVSERLVRIG